MPIFYQLPKIDNVPIIDYLDKDFADTEYEINCYVGDRIQIDKTPISNSFFLIPHDFNKIQNNIMSGSAGGNRIPRSAVEKTVKEYIDKHKI